MTVKNLRNFMFADIISPFAGNTTEFTVASGEGARFPATPFNALLYDYEFRDNPAEALYAGKAESVSVTDIEGDTLTVERGQEESESFTSLVGHRYRLLLDDTESESPPE